MPTVLVVDDEAPVRAFVARTAEAAGWTTTEAADAETALAVLARTHVDLVCLDIRLPGKDGIQVADVVHDRHPGTAVLFMTGLDVLPADKTLRSGVVGYLVKPFESRELLGILTTLHTPGAEPPSPPPPPPPPPHPHLRRVK
ncbi:MAG: response regulator [Vicinamibacterales bacterium]